uniref:Transcriptional adapter 1-like n=1 Tax=Hirondellea gigas TaxID=1518452 RepID=A0A2P2I5B9_9CRUS
MKMSSSVSNESLNSCKKMLVEALGDQQTSYFLQMKDWFRGKVTKEQFDSNARDLLPSSTVHLHNEFLLAILTKCQLFSTTAPPPTVTVASSSYNSPSHLSSNGITVSLPHTSTSRSRNSSNNLSSSLYTPPTSATITPATSLPNDIFNTFEYDNPKSSYSNNVSQSSRNTTSSATYTSYLIGNSSTSNSTTQNSSSKLFTTSSSNDPSSLTNINSSSNSNNVSNTNSIFNALLNSTPGNALNNYNSSTSNNILGSNTSAFTVNNSSSNIRIKVEVPMHSLEHAGLGLGGALPTITSSTDKKKIVRPPKKKLKSNKHASEPVFEAPNVLSMAPSPVLREPQVLRDSRAGHHTTSHCLLGLGELRGRLLLAAWDHGLNAATEGVVRLLHHAARQLLLTVLSNIIKNRAGFRVREGCFVHSLGTCPPNPWLRSASAASDWTSDSIGTSLSGNLDSSNIGERPQMLPTAEAAQHNAAHLMSFDHHLPPPLQPINCLDLYTTLKVSPWILPCHTTYSLNMERISSRLSHLDHAALAQEAVVKQEQQHRRHLRQYRMLPSL